MFLLQCDTPPQWTERVCQELDDFLIDHAACERKASATAMSFVVRYRDIPNLVTTMITVAQEELDHFAQVTEIVHKRGLQLGSDQKDPYVNALLKLARHSPRERLIDRLLIFGIIEGRGCERFQMISEADIDPDLKIFYADLVRAEARHHAAFLHIVRELTDEQTWRPRLNALLEAEAEIVRTLPIRAALH
jgi:tRNA-(ms[2]io[6]A)-hydroxylase